VTALVRYTVAVLLHTQHHLAPVLLFVGFLAVSTVNGGGPLPPVYASSAGALFVCAVWLTATVLGLDNPEQRAVVVVSAGRSSSVLAASVVTALLASTALGVVGLVFPLWMGDYHVGPADLVLGAVAALACACAGGGAGVLCSRLVIPRQGNALVAALVVIGVFLFSRGLPPVNPLIRKMSATTHAAGVLSFAAGMLGVAVAFLVVATVVAGFVSTPGLTWAE
jgi:hypothetical protein